jgi:SAM-dependent methyltransferase
LVKVSRDDVVNACTLQGQFVIPESIQRAIENSISNPIAEVAEEFKHLSDKYKKYRKLMIPIKVDYHGELTLDAYVAYYLARNMLIPWIALRDLCSHPRFQTLPSKLRVLDLGSGTGAVSLGLLHLFHRKPFSDVAIHIVAVDSHKEALTRQEMLVKKAGFSSSHLTTVEADLSDVESYVSKVEALGPFDLIFVANCITELKAATAKALLATFPQIMTNNGAVIVAEAQRDYVKARIAGLARNAPESGLFVYYPCPTYLCERNDDVCWVWRDHQYLFPDLRVGGDPLPEDPREKLTLSWLILTKQKISLYDVLRHKDRSLTWGPIARQKSWDKEKQRNVVDLGACDGTEVVAFKKDIDVSLDYDRGSVSGLSSEGILKDYFDLQ